MLEPGKVLSQAEVDALLSAITTGEVEVGAEEQEARQVLAYDFRRPERVARDQLRAISTLHDVFARNLQALLSGILRSLVDVRVQGVDQLTFSEFINSLPNPTVFTIVTAEPFEGNFVLEMNPIIAFPILERLLGSNRGSATQPERPLTDIEWGLIEGILARVLEHLSEAWAKVAPVTFKMSGHESNPHLVPIMSSNEPVISVVIELGIGDARGFLNLCIPVVAIESVLEKITAHTWFMGVRKATAGLVGAVVASQIANADVEIAATLATTSLTLDQLRQLTVGAQVVTDQPVKQPIVVHAEGRPKFLALPCALKDRIAIRIVRRLTEEEERRMLSKGA